NSQGRRSIFQVDGEQDSVVAAVNEAEAAAQADDPSTMETAPTGPAESGDSKIRPHGVIETYFASNSFGASYPGLNFAVATPVSENIELIFSGQTGLGEAQERVEATTRIRIGDRHRVGLTASGLRLDAPVWTSSINNQDSLRGQISLRAIAEWIVRDGIVIVMGLDYSRFLGAGGAHSITPRFGVQYDVNARTRVKAAFASGGDEDGIQSVATFEDEQVVFRGNSVRPVAFIDGQ